MRELAVDAAVDERRLRSGFAGEPAEAPVERGTRPIAARADLRAPARNHHVPSWRTRKALRRPAVAAQRNRIECLEADAAAVDGALGKLFELPPPAARSRRSDGWLGRAHRSARPVHRQAGRAALRTGAPAKIGRAHV